MARQVKFRHKKFFSALWPPLFPMYTVYLHYTLINPPATHHRQEHLLNPKEQQQDNVLKITFLLNLVRSCMTHQDDAWIWIAVNC